MKKKKLNQSSGDLLQDFVKTKIISKINGMINNLKFKDDMNNDKEMEVN